MAKTVTFESIVETYAESLAVVADESPATEIDAFISQLSSASYNMDIAGLDINDVDAAATYLADARSSTGSEQQVLLAKVWRRLQNSAELFDDFKMMI